MDPNPQPRPKPLPPRGVALCGSLRADSHSRKALELAIVGAKKAGGEVTLVDLEAAKLPPFDDGPSKQTPEALRPRWG